MCAAAGDTETGCLLFTLKGVSSLPESQDVSKKCIQNIEELMIPEAEKI